jgi:hypothetical protein
MGLKSSPYHLNKFIEKAFSQEVHDELLKQLPADQQKLVPPSFEHYLRSYFDDKFIFADNYEFLYVCFKMVLMAARKAKIKYSIEKSSFFTTKLKILGYSFDTKDVHLTMDKLKASGFLNTKKPSSLYELHSRLAAFQYQSSFLPYIKHILYPLHFLLRKKEFTWGPIEELSWQLAKQLATLNLRLTIPDPEDDLVLTSDASKIAAAACLFRVKDNKLQLVSVTSKYFSAVDLKKHSYMLEAISLAYGLKTFAPYILNCQGKVKIFTDAKALIYAKRQSTHSILLNSTINYLSNIVSLVNVELYHIPGTVNVLADILSRAIADNLNCNLTREHPLSKQWAAVIPPIPENFSVDNKTLYKFLTTSLQPEPMDIHNRIHRKLSEPKTLNEAFQLSQTISPEEKYFNALTLLEQWNSEYARTHATDTPHIAAIHAIKLEIDLEKHKLCMEKLQDIMETVYVDIKDTPLYKKLLKNLAEVSKRYLYCKQQPLTNKNIQYLNDALEETLNNIGLMDKERTISFVYNTDKQNFVTQAQSIQTPLFSIFHEKPIVLYQLSSTAAYLPKICPESNGLDIPLQEKQHFQPNELKISFYQNITVRY